MSDTALWISLSIAYTILALNCVEHLSGCCCRSILYLCPSAFCPLISRLLLILSWMSDWNGWLYSGRLQFF
jgi:hypothetical protein